MQFIVAIALVAALATAMPSDLFEKFIAEHNKVYATPAEKEHRFKIFQETLKRIETLNEGEPFRPHGINQFADMTQEEFAAKYLMDKSVFKQMSHRKNIAPAMDLSKFESTLPASFDWRTHTPAVLTPVKNQEQCGSCWAFSTTENIESVWALAGNTLVSLAPQQIVDCDTTDAGCNGGNPPTAYEYVIKAGGMEPETDYPYVAKDTKCTFNKADVVAKISGYEYATKTKNETEIRFPPRTCPPSPSASMPSHGRHTPRASSPRTAPPLLTTASRLLAGTSRAASATGLCATRGEPHGATPDTSTSRLARTCAVLPTRPPPPPSNYPSHLIANL